MRKLYIAPSNVEMYSHVCNEHRYTALLTGTTRLLRHTRRNRREPQTQSP